MIKISKSQFKGRALRRVQQTKEELIITDHGRPVLKIVPYREDTDNILARLRGTVIDYRDPTEPVGVEYWEALR